MNHTTGGKNGPCQPPRKKVTAMADTVIMLAYSAMKNVANFILLYSVWYPATSSDSASGRSKGHRFTSAIALVQKKKNPMRCNKIFHSFDCPLTTSTRLNDSVSMTTPISDNPRVSS